MSSAVRMSDVLRELRYVCIEVVFEDKDVHGV